MPKFTLLIRYASRGEKAIMEFDTAAERRAEVENSLRADAETIDWDSDASREEWVSGELESLEYGQIVTIDDQDYEYV